MAREMLYRFGSNLQQFHQTHVNFSEASSERPAVAAKVAGHVSLAAEVAQVAVVVLAVVEHLKQQIRVRVALHFR